MQRFLASAGFPHLVLFLCQVGVRVSVLVSQQNYACHSAARLAARSCRPPSAPGLHALTLTSCLRCSVAQLAFAVMAISSHPALEFIPPLTYCALRIGLAIPLLAVSARVQVRISFALGVWVSPFYKAAHQFGNGAKRAERCSIARIVLCGQPVRFATSTDCLGRPELMVALDVNVCTPTGVGVPPAMAGCAVVSRARGVRRRDSAGHHFHWQPPGRRSLLRHLQCASGVLTLQAHFRTVHPPA